MGDKEKSSASETVKNLVLVGRTGNGKRATGNSLIGKEVFMLGATECQTHKAKTPEGLIFNVIDTPGLFDLSLSPDYINKEINNCLMLAEGGLHAVVLVVSVGTQISEEEDCALSTLQLLFGSKIVDYLVVLFNGGDVLEEENKTLDDYLSTGCPEYLKTVLRLCGGRRVLFNNNTTDRNKKVEQVQQLLAHVAAIEKNNGGKAFAEMQLKIKRENEMLMEKGNEVESKDPAETDVEELKTQLEMSYGQNMNMMLQMVENTIKESSVSQEIMMLALRENLENSLKEKKSIHKGPTFCNII